ncbi:MAG: EAL domain-containing protein [Pseudomonadota bacterium]
MDGTTMQLIDDFDVQPDELAYTDTLTGLGNNRRFLRKLENTLAEREDDPVPFAIGVIDIDGFKPINDLFGKSAGDAILKQMSLRLQAVVGDEATVARIGGDEFGVILPSTFHEKSAAEFGRTLTEILAAPFDVGERTARLAASVGLSLFSEAADSAETLITKAEAALYASKKISRGGFVVYTHEMEEAARKAAVIEQALRRAVSAGEVEPHFQPIVDLKTRQTIGFECLSRWVDRDLGFVSPAVFIPIAEERGIITAMSKLVLRKAAEAAAQWPDHLFLAFNLSPSQLVDGNTGLQILSILEKAGFPPNRLEVEITETGVMTDPASASKIIDDLRSAGIRVSLDDFGTGQSSLGRLRDIQFDKLKIDRAFIAELLSDRPSEHIVKAILAMSEGLGMDVVAEGIEDEAIVERLIEFGCANGQGYYFGKPADELDTLGYLRDSFRGAMRVKSA